MYKTNDTALFGYTICMPTECDKIMNSYHPKLLITDIINYVWITFLGSKLAYNSVWCMKGLWGCFMYRVISLCTWTVIRENKIRICLQFTFQAASPGYDFSRSVGIPRIRISRNSMLTGYWMSLSCWRRYWSQSEIISHCWLHGMQEDQREEQLLISSWQHRRWRTHWIPQFAIMEHLLECGTWDSSNVAQWYQSRKKFFRSWEKNGEGP